MTISTATLSADDVDHELIWGWVSLVTAALAASVIKLIGIPPIACPFKALTGLPCLTCGATRAVAALLRGDFAASLRFHPLVIPAVVCATMYVPYALLVAHAGLPRIRVRLDDGDWKMVRMVTAVVAAVVWGFLILDGR